MANHADLEQAERLPEWCQGDYALNVGGHLYAHVPAPPSEFQYDAEELTDGIVGLIVVSQTCDIINPGGGHCVTVCPLIKHNEGEAKSVQKGYRPSLVALEHPPAPNVFADLSRVMAVSKELLCRWERRIGFSDPRQQRRFAAALERKFGRFAFPDDIDRALKSFKERVWQRHDKAESKAGRVYRSFREIRLRSAPSWNAKHKEIALLFIQHDEARREATGAEIQEELKETLEKINLPEGYKWSNPKYEMATAQDFRASDLYESQPLDFEYLCT